MTVSIQSFVSNLLRQKDILQRKQALLNSHYIATVCTVTVIQSTSQMVNTVIFLNN